MWAKTSRTGTVGQVDDQYVDSTRYDKEKSPEAGRKSDPKTGDEVPGILVAPFTGDRGEISARYSYLDGVRTVEVARKPVTGSEFDVQVRHAFSTGVLKPKLE
jgi:hypothetical protein